MNANKTPSRLQRCVCERVSDCGSGATERLATVERVEREVLARSHLEVWRNENPESDVNLTLGVSMKRRLVQKPIAVAPFGFMAKRWTYRCLVIAIVALPLYLLLLTT